MGITSYKFPITNFHSVWLFLPAQIFINAATIVLPFRQYPVVVSFPQVGDPWLSRLLPFRQKQAGELKTSIAMDISVFEGIFGLKSRIFTRNYKLPISNYECDHLHFSICDYLVNLSIFFSLIHADLFSAPICDFNLRISA